MGDLLLVQAYLVDPVQGIRGYRDIMISRGRIEQVAPSLSAKGSAKTLDMNGALVVPGLIDSHVHVAGPMDRGFTMLAKAGVTTAIDFCGPVESVLQRISQRGTPVNIGVLEMVRPGRNLPEDSWTRQDVRRAVEDAPARGALGVKVLGGHFPLDEQTTRDIFIDANDLGCYAAFHAGTREVGEPFLAFRQAVSLAEGLNLHIAHINSYCRGRYKAYIQEMAEALETLQKHPNIRSGSYLSNYNGTFGGCRDGVPISGVTAGELAKGGYDQTEAGLEQAVRDGYAQVCAEQPDEIVLTSGEEGVRAWRKLHTSTMICFSVNPAANAAAFALHRGSSREFTIDVLNTDGGGIPRNTMIELGLPLTRFSEFSIEDFVWKTSCAPAQLFGLENKGHLREGADADITVMDSETYRPVMSFVCGEPVLSQGQVLGSPGKFITSMQGREYVASLGIGYTEADVAKGSLYCGRKKS